MGKHVSYGTAIKLAGAYTAYHIGSGFATGNEIMQFFVSWGGYTPFAVFAIAIIFAAVTNFIMYRTGYLKEFKKPNQYYYYFCGKMLGRIFDYYVYITLVAFVLVMITGSGATIRQYFDIPEYVGTIFMGVLCSGIACLGLRKLVDVLGSIGIVIMSFTIFCGIYMIVTADASPIAAAQHTQQYVSDGTILQPSFFGITNPVIAGLFYAGILMLALPWVTSMGKLLTDIKQTGVAAFCSALFLFSAAMSVAVALMINLDAVAGTQIPMLAAVQHTLPALALPYSIVIILGIFTTATGMLFLLSDRFATEGSKKSYAIIFGTAAFGAIGGTFIPFSVIVNIVYSVLGFSGDLLAILMIIKFIRVYNSRSQSEISASQEAESPSN